MHVYMCFNMQMQRGITSKLYISFFQTRVPVVEIYLAVSISGIRSGENV